MPSLTPWVKRILILWGVLWLISFLSELSGHGLSGYLALDPAIFHGSWWRFPGIVTYALVHDPNGFLHVGFNAYLLWAFGPEVEVLFPRRRFLNFVLVATLAGSLLHLAMALIGGPWFGASVVGGSGIVMAVIAVHAAVYPTRILNLILFRIPMLWFFLALVVLDLLGFIAIAAGRGGTTAADVHLAGAAVGWLWAGGLQRFDTPLARWAEKRRRKSEQSARDRARQENAELDRILAKISREGISSLSRSEKKFLNERSRKG